MKRTIQTTITVFSIAVLSTTLMGTEPDRPISKGPLTIDNEFIKIVVNQNTQDQGRFAIETTSGDPGNPSDNEQSLIYGRPIPWTSYTTLRIDDDDYIFGGPSRKLEKRTGKELQTGTPVRQVTTDDRIITDFDYDGITARQVLSFFRTPTTRVKDSALIEYEITNKTKKSITLGIRVMLDTKLGSNDGAPFRIGSRAITSEILVPKADLLPYWQTFDSLTAPTVVAQGTLESPEDGLTPPDRLVLANWGTLADNPWAADYQEGRSFVRVGEEEKDTALALMWEPITLRPGQSRRIRTAYGLGGVTLAAGDLSLGLTAPAEATAGSSRDLFVIAYITNTGGFNSRETTATLVLPKGVEVSNGSHIVHLGQLKVGETRQIPFRIKTKSARKGTWPITLKVTSATLAPNQIQRSILLHAPQTATASVVSPPTVDPALNRYIEAQVIVTNPHESPLESVVVSLKSPAQPWFEIPSKSIPILPPGKTVTLDWQIGPISSKTPTLNLEVFISSFGMDPEKVGQQVDVTNGPSILTGKLSQPSYKVGEFGYITLCGQPGQNVSGELRIEGNALRALRITKDEWAKSVSVSTTPEALIFSNAMIPATRSGSILRWHFKAVTSGNAAIHIISDRGTTTIPITITD